MDLCIIPMDVCNGEQKCSSNDDIDYLCANGDNSKIRCDRFWSLDRRITKQNILCSLDDSFRFINFDYRTVQYFSLANYSILIPITVRPTPMKLSKRSVLTALNVGSDDQPEKSNLLAIQCHRGMPIYMNEEIKCLCPPSLYGSRCEYQNQRVSITLQIGAPEWRTAFVFVIYLVDDIDQTINSYHQIRYLSTRDCNRKFNFHLLYLSQPKHFDRLYSIRIDLFEMNSLKYRTSWFFPILFSFLPVYRMPIQLTVPFSSVSLNMKCPLQCQSDHGRCTAFLNTGKYFCLCQPGWTGPLCTIPYQCNCSPDSICIGLWKNRSICVCSTYKFGRRCYLNNNLCDQSSTRKCQNNGQCIPRDLQTSLDQSTICSCPYGFHGDRCQLNETRIDISIAMPNLRDSFLLHFITVYSDLSSQPYRPKNELKVHERTTTFKRIPIDSNDVTIYWQNPFHLLFVQYDGELYLMFSQLTYVESIHLKTKLEPHMRCPNMAELFEESIDHYSRLRRAKYYHIPCQQDSNRNCFHDNDQFICLCTYDRRANCFTFDHRMKYDCQQLSYCENHGQCFQNRATCPTSAICACPKCYLGTRCQLSTRGFALPLDVILGYQIRPGLPFRSQPSSVLVSGIMTIIMFVFGLINGSCCLMTFKEKNLQQVGCGIYLFIASMISLLTTIVFTFKYLSLVLIQLMFITNRRFLFNQCVLVDFLLKILLQIGDWLYACVAIERLISSIKGASFKNKRSQQIAKWIVLVVVLIVVGTSIQEPPYRILIDDEDEGRTWCIIRYPNSYSNALNQLTTITTLVHFIGPFVINIISALGIIFVTAQSRSKANKNLSFRQHIRTQFVLHKNLIISPIILILLALPRIVLAFQLECMQSARDPVTLFLIGYFVSFLPPLLLFIVFIIPSDLYRKAFKRVVRKPCH